MVRKIYKLLHEHEWVKTTSEPEYDYLTYDGYLVGVFKCKCKYCGKTRMCKYW
jgi:hypothetical protein